MGFPTVGASILVKPLSEDTLSRFSVSVARTLDDFQRATALRAATYMAEQKCPFEEEFDGNDLSATHLIGWDGKEPVGTLRIRWFAGFAKIERVCVLPSRRGSSIIKLMMAHCFEIGARKGYSTMLAHIQTRLLPLWSNTFECCVRRGRAEFSFSDFDYSEIEIPLPPHPSAITLDEDPYLLIRPEGAWDESGILDQSAKRTQSRDEAA